MTDLHAVEPVSIDRLAQLCELIDADYAILEAPRSASDAGTDVDTQADRAADDDAEEKFHRVLQTGIPHIAVHCDLNEEGDTLSAFATWEGTLPESAEEEVAATVAELNWASVAPTLSYFVTDGPEEPSDGAEVQLCANRAMAVGEGLSLAQLGHFLLSSLASFAEIFEVVAERFPQAVTWNAATLNDMQEQEAED
ncbi:hypothetical protein [Corynebacterium minutissimum]|uniref:YbjN domain-containing protein n=1 Tax=Corynebacterium minutissimum TaxID=38301 RepID=A0A2X4RUS7_9CORY|nr:hypothetical protein [Corynebacterium minutissimum]MCG7229045.1 hypothetical protein [Corynebacterium minutissimum]MCG7238162.1 hypothetical protein [Corynebacterium minutissimum]QPS58822.1 hypothetical protein I6G51_07695 [Corynebacterium minutissimum]QQA80388.1 hypothetical protein I6H49_05165 [Corynebacterium minutissimum]SQI00050.1 Uncharacterised protein [Corynebacterium minutissimum]